MLQIVFCSVIYQNNGHNMTYRWRKELAVTKFMMFSLKPTSTSATKPTPFGNAYSPVRVTPIKSPKRYWMSQWASEYTDSSLIKKILPQGSAAVSCCSWFSAFILGALQGALMFCLLIHFEKLLFARCDWILNTSFVHNFLCRPPVQALPDVPTAGHP